MNTADVLKFFWNPATLKVMRLNTRSVQQRLSRKLGTKWWKNVGLNLTNWICRMIKWILHVNFFFQAMYLYYSLRTLFLLKFANLIITRKQKQIFTKTFSLVLKNWFPLSWHLSQCRPVSIDTFFTLSFILLFSSEVLYVHAK